MVNSYFSDCKYLALVVCCIAILISFLLGQWLHSTTVVLLILQLSIVFVALNYSSRMVYSAAIFEAIAFNFLHTAPRYSLQMFHIADVINLAVFIAVAFCTSELAKRYRTQQSNLKQVQLRNQILLSVSHDLRTPLAGIIGNLSTLKRYYSQLTQQQVTELLDSATVESHRLHHYIENLLHATKLQHGEIQMVKHVGSMVDVLTNAMERLGDRRSKVHVTVKIGQTSTLMSAALLEQAIFNVLDNAVTYSFDRQPVEVNVYRTHHHLAIDVFNQCDGFKPEMAKQVFNLFYSEKKLKSADSGIGLGLCVAKGIVEAHQGSMHCQAVNGGCLISLTLPFYEQGENE